MVQLATIFFLVLSSFSEVNNKPYEVYIFLHDECIISRYYTLTLNDLYAKYKDIAHFTGVFPNTQVDQDRMDGFQEKYEVKFELLFDKDYVLTNEFGATVTPEVFVVDIESDEVVYFGRIDNAYARVGRKRTRVTRHELANVLDDLRNKKMTNVANQPAIGCIITQVIKK